MILHGISFELAAGERIGVVGRTGAGKSSLLIALFRIVEPEAGSTIRLDGEDILTMGLQDLRSCITMIPQDPVLFEGTLRYNCDPLRMHDDESLWAALEEAQLASWLRQQQATSLGGEGVSLPSNEAQSEISSPLGMKIKEGGQNLSMGQRQMVAIARAVLRRSKLVVLDEATAAVDTATDAAIQQAIRQCFCGASTLTIAHRLETIQDSDRILVLEAGHIAEFAPPQELLEKEHGIFRSMVCEQQTTRA